MTWFQQITGFPEADYDTTQSLLHVEGEQLVSRHSPRRWGIGRFETPTLAQLRQRVAEQANPASGPLRFTAITADARALHCDPANAQALFQVPSQFNALEMVGPSVTTEHGVSRSDTFCGLLFEGAKVMRGEAVGRSKKGRGFSPGDAS